MNHLRRSNVLENNGRGTLKEWTVNYGHTHNDTCKRYLIEVTAGSEGCPYTVSCRRIGV